MKSAAGVDGSFVCGDISAGWQEAPSQIRDAKCRLGALR